MTTQLGQEEGGPELADTDPTLLCVLRWLMDEFGPLGVKRTVNKLYAEAAAADA